MFIKSNNKLPGISGLLADRPRTAKPLTDLAEVLLRGESTLEVWERELIATFVSYMNGCNFCMNSHGAIVDHILGSHEMVYKLTTDFENAPVTPKMKALLFIATAVQAGGRVVTEEEISYARLHKATDDEIHDTVLIAAAFCMYNRYVDGLGTFAPTERSEYVEAGKHLAENGYTR